jgi:hypothetical protein
MIVGSIFNIVNMTAYFIDVPLGFLSLKIPVCVPWVHFHF